MNFIDSSSETFRWVKDYPEAPGEAAFYGNIASRLAAQKSNLDNSLSISLPSLSNLSFGETQKGQYYIVYDGKTAEWVEKTNSMHRDLSTFSSELAERIGEASALQAMWTSRIPLGHWEGTDDDWSYQSYE